MSVSNDTKPASKLSTAGTIIRWIAVLALVYLLIAAVSTIGAGFKQAAGERAKDLFAFATNPFLGLIIGTVATALIQSSSTVTSIIVGLVAGGVPVATAVPMVMGANIGTTITNTIVSLGHVNNKDEFKRAFSAATVHDFFNVISVVVFLPLEIMFHPLEKMGAWMANLLVGGGSYSMKGLNFVKPATKPLLNFFHTITDPLGDLWGGIALIVVGITLIFFAIFYIGKFLKVLMVGRAKQILHTAIGRGPISGITSGTLVTTLVQSSSTTTSLVVPLAGTGVFTLREIYPFTLGANIGTTITALLAATAITTNAEAAMQIAMIHFLYNLLGVVVIYGIPFLRDLPIYGSERLAKVAAERKTLALAYVVGTFFVLPAICVGVSEIFKRMGA